ncbi:MAG: hypothetical protein K5685_02855 [Bacteroidales bacterium]|nr:hypothetical protein [Bacteroidales bacterium]
MLRTLAVIILSVVFNFMLSAQVKETVLNENFTDNLAGWPEDINNVYTASVNSGVYYIEHKRNYGSKCFDIPTQLYPGTNYFIELKSKIKSGDASNGIGIVWGKSDFGYFTFVVTGDGKFYARKIQKGEQGEYLIEPKSSQHVQKTGNINTIRVQYSEGELMFFINGKYVAHIPSQKYFGDNAGVILYGRQVAEVYNFGIYGSKNYEPLLGYNAKMKFSHCSIDDNVDPSGVLFGNGDCRIQPGETVKLNVTLRNQGFQKTGNLLVNFYVISDYVKILNQNVPQPLNDVSRNQSQTFDLIIKVNEFCNLDNLKFKIDITDDKERLAESLTFSIPTRTYITPANKTNDDGITFTLSLRESNTGDINRDFPITTNSGKDICAVVIGVESYLSCPKALYAKNDAQIFYNYLVKVVNVPRQNIIYVTDKQANRYRIGRIFAPGGELQTIIENGARNVVVYFSGLGITSPKMSQPYMMLYDTEAATLLKTGYGVLEMYNAIAAMKTISLICLFESNFNGLDRAGNSFLPNNQQQKTAVQFPSIKNESTCMFYASGGSEFNPVEETTFHGMFTHYILSALKNYGENRKTLDMENLYEAVFRGMTKNAAQKNLTVFPKMDCTGRYDIKLLK